MALSCVNRDYSDALVRIHGDPGTLYAKCEDIDFCFGVSAFVDRCMDKWSADDLLSHHQAQRCVFKFLVVQVVCNLTGGRSLEQAHNHLNISEEEWGSFVKIFSEVCEEFGLSGEGRLLGSEMQKTLDGLLEEDPDLRCPVSLMLFVDPVIASDGFMYEKAFIEGLLRNCMASPMTREPLIQEFVPAEQLQTAAMEFRQARSQELLRFAEEAAAAQPQMACAALQRASDYLEVLKPSQVPEVAKQAAKLWGKLGQPVPASLALV